MKKTTLAAALAAAIGASGGANSGTIEDELAAIKARLQALESQVQDQNRTIQEQNRALAEKNRQIQELVENPEIRRDGDTGSGWFNSVEIGGVIEFEAGYADPDQGKDESDFTIATAELGVAAQINDWVGSEITLLYEEAFGNDQDEDTDLEVDVAIISIANPDGPWGIVAGQQYVPFGTYETTMIGDPLTLELGETRETALLGGVEVNGFFGGAYLFNGDIDEDGDNKIDSFGAFGGYSQEYDDVGFAVNVGYISNIGDSDGLQDTIDDNLGGADFEDQVAGFTIDGNLAVGPFTFIAEYTTALDDFEANELAFKGDGAEPEAFNIEAAYGFMLAGKEATVAIGYQETDEAVALGLPEERIRAGISIGIMDNTTLSFEWANDDDYSASDRDGEDKVGGDTFTSQLAVEF